MHVFQHSTLLLRHSLFQNIFLSNSLSFLQSAPLHFLRSFDLQPFKNIKINIFALPFFCNRVFYRGYFGGTILYGVILTRTFIYFRFSDVFKLTIKIFILSNCRIILQNCIALFKSSDMYNQQNWLSVNNKRQYGRWQRNHS